MNNISHPAVVHQGQFIRTAWYSRGLKHGNPYFNKRFRVNAPETSLTPDWMYRSEARENGMMLIRIEEDLALLDSAELYAEIWGGHPGTANKRLSVNGRSSYALPETGTAAGHCTHSYPHIPLKLTDLVNGYNAIQFACDMGTGFWGHYIVDNAAIKVVLQRQHPDLSLAGLADFDASVNVSAVPDQEDMLHLELALLPAFQNKISHVEFEGYYSGYDENGNGKNLDWHGYTKKRKPVGIIGKCTHPPFAMLWDTSMIVAQSDVAVRAVVYFRDLPNLVYQSPNISQLQIKNRVNCQVTQLTTKNQPIPFWSRDGQRRLCTFTLDLAPEEIKRAELHVTIWDGGAGSVQTPFTFNDYPLRIVGSGAHDVLYRKIRIKPSILKNGENELVLLSDTEHHGIEVLLPGPCLVIRT